MHQRACVYTRLGGGGRAAVTSGGGSRESVCLGCGHRELAACWFQRQCQRQARAGGSQHAFSGGQMLGRGGSGAEASQEAVGHLGAGGERGVQEPGAPHELCGELGAESLARDGGKARVSGKRVSACPSRMRAGSWTERWLLTGAGAEGAGKHQGRPGPSLRCGLPVRTASPPSEAVFVKGQTGWFRWNQSLWHRHCHTEVLGPPRRWCAPPAHGRVRETGTGRETETGTEIRGDLG